jgi:hypothetical protein
MVACGFPWLRDQSSDVPQSASPVRATLVWVHTRDPKRVGEQGMGWCVRPLKINGAPHYVVGAS